MKKTLFYLVVASTLLACVKSGDIITPESSATTITISLLEQEGRTSLGNKEGDTYPVYWSEGDCIAINGVCLEADIDEKNKACAKFDLGVLLQQPYHITYPYTAHSTAEEPKVVFPAEQTYTKGSFAKDSAPMCGYSTSSDNVQLTHLASILQFPIKAAKEGVTLEKVVITSTANAKLSGIFHVDCTKSEISPSQDCGNSVTLTLPSDFTLSTTSTTPLYISIPSGISDKCTIEFIEASGNKMTATWNPTTPISRGVVREFDTITYKEGAHGELLPMIAEEEEFIIHYKTIYGYVRDIYGNPIKDVPVSDGFSIVTTDANGYYTIEVSRDTWYIYITLPSEYEVPINEIGQACFWKEYPSSSPRYDFTLTPLKGGKEEKFALFTFGDPQVSSDPKLARFTSEAVPAIKAHYDELSKEMNCYGITLGDIISMSSSSDSSRFRYYMRDGFCTHNVGLPVFHVMGNHDCNFYNASKPAFPDERNSTYNIKVQRDHETVFGPVNYSFNRGDVHIIGMRNIYYTSNTAQSIKLGFLDEQVEWLKQDLALVPKDHTVLFCVHVPMMKDNTLYNTPEVMELLNTYPKMHIISGHRHFVWNYEYAKEGTKFTNIYEHVVGAICGAWWRTNMCGDGAPCGYGVFVGEGKDITDWYHIGIHDGMDSRSHQMRLYRGNAITGAAIEGSNSYGTKGYYAFNFSEDTLLANVYFADSGWTMKVYEDGVYSGNMTKVPYVRRPVLTSFAGDGSLESPFTPKIATSNDTYVTGLMLGVLGHAEGSSGVRDECYHMYQYKLKNKDAEIKVEAIDRFGNIYTETKITVGTDYSITKAK